MGSPDRWSERKLEQAQAKCRVQAVTDILLRPNTIAVGIACVREEQGDMAYSRAQTTFKMVKAFHRIKHVAAPVSVPRLGNPCGRRVLVADRVDRVADG